MSPMWTKSLLVVSALLSLLATLLLYWGSMSYPAEKQSWKGGTGPELAFKRRQAVFKWVGVPAAIVAAMLQIIVILAQER